MRHIKVCGRDVRIEGRLLRVGRLEGDRYEFIDEPGSLIEGLQRSSTRIDLFTFLQRLPDTSPKHAYPMEYDNLAAVPLSTYEHWWKNQIRPEARNRARQAQKKGVVVREVPFNDELVRGIWKIYNECPIRQGRRFPHYGKDLDTVYREEATFLDKSFFIGAYLGETLIGFVKLTMDDGRKQANLMNILSMVEHRDKAPTNALISQSVRSCAERGISYLVYQSFAYGRKQVDGITRFKQVNGFQRFELPRYYVPLTSLGWVGVRLGLHRRLVDRVPELVLSRLRKLRSAWYDRKFQTVREAA